MSHLIFIIGAPRSGTTWLAKVFDSHPDVLYRHEPDLVDPAPDIPLVCNEKDRVDHVEAIRRHVDRWVATRNLKAVGTFPVFAKSFDRPFGRPARLLTIGALRLKQTLSGRAVHDHALPTEFHDPKARAPSHVVIKSISALGRAGVLAEALPEARIILIMRNPLAQIASRSIGVARAKLEAYRFKPELLDTPQARRLELTAGVLERATMQEQMAWEWVILNEKACDELTPRANAMVVRYSDVVMRPVERMRALFQFAGVSWRAETEAFIRRSVNYRGPDLYFQVLKDAERSLNKWRDSLSVPEQERVRSVIEQSHLAGLWPEHFRSAAQPLSPA